MKNSIAQAAVCLALASLALSANAAGLTTSVSAGPTTNVVGATTFDFGVTLPTNDSGPVSALGSVTYNVATYTGGELFNTASAGVSGIAARPVGSAGNFWSIEGGQTGTVSFATPVSYYGFLWGSPDAAGWNSVTFYHGNTLLGTFDGTVISSSNAWTNTAYFNVSTGNGPSITSIAFSANQNAFETDNHSFITAVPEPETYAMMLAGLGLLGFMSRRRKQQQASA